MALLATALLSAPALAANGREVWLGSPDGVGGSGAALDYGSLTNHDPVTVGRRAATTLHFENEGGQTLNHVRLAGGAVANELPYNTLFPRPVPNSLPGGASFAKVIVLAGSATCNPDAGISFECDLGSLSAGEFVDFLIVVDVPATAGVYPYWVTGSWNEGWASTGTNADYQFAVGSLDVKTGCGNGSASYFLGTQSVALDDGASIPCNGADASVASLANVGGNGGFAKMAVDSTDITCPAGFKCFGKPVSVSILGGAPVPGGVEWTVKWFGTKTLKGVIHYGDAYPTVATDFVAIPLTKANKCSATKLTDCWVGTSTSSGNTKPVWIQVIFRTDSNGKGGGFL